MPSLRSRWSKTAPWAVGCALLAAGAAPKPQPLPFSHKAHVALGQKCLDCHTMPEPGDLATLPKEEKCMACHTSIKTESAAIQKLSQFYKARRSVPWVRIYKIPDYVWFSHKQHHVEAKLACETCHGPVADRDVITQEKPATMKACMDCHDQLAASVACNACHT